MGIKNIQFQLETYCMYSIHLHPPLKPRPTKHNAPLAYIIPCKLIEHNVLMHTQTISPTHAHITQTYTTQKPNVQETG